MPKTVEISNFELQKCFIPQKKAENMYNVDLVKKVIFIAKKEIFL